ncbi:unnamed protein product [Rotaria socialis]
MASVTAESSKPSTRVQWMWNAQTDPLSKSQPAEWHPYSDVENMIIEKAFTADKTEVMLDEYHIDLKCNLQVSNSDVDKQRSVKRVVCNGNDKRAREERFMHNPVAPKRPVGGQYGFVPPFIKEAAKDLNLTPKQFPSKNRTVIPMLIEKAALGIIEEGKNIKKQREGEEMANKLMEKKNAGMEEVWKCCAELYSMESFLYKKLNEIMGSIGSEQHEQVWRSKIRTWGPFCLLLWDNPFNGKITKPGTILYRGATLSDDSIASFQEDCTADPKPWRSFQSFTSSTRNRNVAEQFGNALFVMKTRLAFTIDLSELSEYFHEQEELIYPGVSFKINRMEFDKDKNKHLIYLNLQQRHDSKSS